MSININPVDLINPPAPQETSQASSYNFGRARLPELMPRPTKEILLSTNASNVMENFYSEAAHREHSAYATLVDTLQQLETAIQKEVRDDDTVIPVVEVTGIRSHDARNPSLLFNAVAISNVERLFNLERITFFQHGRHDSGQAENTQDLVKIFCDSIRLNAGAFQISSSVPAGKFGEWESKESVNASSLLEKTRLADGVEKENFRAQLENLGKSDYIVGWSNISKLFERWARPEFLTVDFLKTACYFEHAR